MKNVIGEEVRKALSSETRTIYLLHAELDRLGRGYLQNLDTALTT